MTETITLELTIEFPGENGPLTKQAVKDFLHGLGESAFVEGVIDGVDIPFDYTDPGRDYYSDLGGDLTPLILYKYDSRELEVIADRLRDAFADKVRLRFGRLKTSDWQEGWKDSFQPIMTSRYYIHPPWDKPDAGQAGDRLPVEIDPGMAFGTGQHATTRLCLEALATVSASGRTLLDVGTGSGILAIAAALSGFDPVLGTDIDADALLSAGTNSRRNGVAEQITFQRGSVPADQQADVVVANILAVVIRPLLPELAQAVSPGGHLILSGLLEAEAAELQGLAEKLPVSLRLESCTGLDEWACLHFRRGAP